MNRSLRLGAWGLAAVAAALIVSCNTGTDTPSGSPASIDLASVQTGAAEMAAIFPICHTGGSLLAPPGDVSLAVAPSWAARAMELRKDRGLHVAVVSSALGATKPADELGDCGGRITYPSYSHSNGVTTGTYAFENYCTSSSGGGKTILNGTTNFVNTGIPGASGPITSEIQATSSSGVTLIVKTAAGRDTSNQKYSFTNYVYHAGVPGGTPTAANPTVISADEVKLTDNLLGKTYRQTNLNLTTFETASGATQMSISGRGYRSNGDYFDIATTSPIVQNSSGSYTGGQMSFTGANNSVAIMTVVPGTTMQGTMTVNGTPVTSGPACK